MGIYIHNAVLRVFILLLFILLTACTAGKRGSFVSQENKMQQTVYFAGFSLTGKQVQTDANFKYTAKVTEETEGGINVLNKKLQNLILNVRNPLLDIKPSELGDYKKGDGLVSAVILDGEEIVEDKIEDNTKLIIILRARIVVVKFPDMKLVASYPVTAEGQSLIPRETGGKGSQEELDALIEAKVRDLYYGAGDNLMKCLLDRFNKINVDTTSVVGIQVGSVDISPDYLKLIKQGEQTADDVKEYIARSFEKYLSYNQQVSVLPYLKDQSFGDVLPSRFSNGDVFTIAIPKPDFRIDLIVNKLKQGVLTESPVERMMGYASNIKVRVSQPEAAKIYLDADFRYVNQRVVPKSGVRFDDREMYLESIHRLFDVFAKQITIQDDEWIKTWSEGKGDVKEQMEEVATKVLRKRRA
jgi:hypothetical protein